MEQNSVGSSPGHFSRLPLARRPLVPLVTRSRSGSKGTGKHVVSLEWWSTACDHNLEPCVRDSAALILYKWVNNLEMGSVRITAIDVPGGGGGARIQPPAARPRRLLFHPVFSCRGHGQAQVWPDHHRISRHTCDNECTPRLPDAFRRRPILHRQLV